MAPEHAESCASSREATERSPLLGNGDNNKDNHGTVDSQQNSQAEAQQGEEGDDDSPLPEEPTTTRLFLVMVSIWMGVFLNAMDGTIVATLSAPISASFDSGTLFSWIASAYLISNAAVQPLSGKLTDIFSRRTGLIWSNIFFLLGNLLCGFAQAQWQIILGRIIAGIGGGCLNTISTFVTSDLVPLRRRGVWQGIGNVFFGLGSGLGGVIGGWISDTWGWRWAFLIQAPFVMISGVIVSFTVNIPVKETDTAKIKRVDFLGSFALVASLVLLLLGLNSGGNIVPWNHPLVYVSLSLATVFLAVFVYVENNIAYEPVLSMKLLVNRTVISACLALWFTTQAFYSYLFYAPIYFESRGYSASAAGLRLMASSFGASFGSLGTGVVMRATGRYYLLNVFVVITLTSGMALMVPFLYGHEPVWLPFVLFALNGFGYGGILTTTLVALIGAVEHKHQAVVTSASYAFRSTGATIGISVASAVFQNILQHQLYIKFGGWKGADELVRKLRDNLDTINTLPSDWQVRAIEAYMDASRGVWITTLALCVAGSLISLFMREHTLYSNLARK